ncbi:YjbH domain-containing protein, partial [Roseobacter sp. HKCCA0434]|uniref:YjbH domain-containing protein n=1 Tax=Roseobacter sp. HKCCA0434 TaxID=3079297 RepID=UPI002905D773
MKRFPRIAALAVGVAACLAAPAALHAQAGPQQWGYPFYEAPRDGLNLYGMTGLIDLPSARMQPDGQLSFTASGFGPTQRYTLSFQALPWLEGALRYSRISDFQVAGTDRFDRSLDLKVRLLDEGEEWWRPEVALGFRDVLGTGVLASEYLVATKEVLPGLDVTGGIGWGRLSGVNGFTNPLTLVSEGFRERSGGARTGGDVDFGGFFSGEDAALFGGVAWRTPIDGLTLRAEYSSDAYEREQITGVFDRASPINYGLEYAIADGLRLGAWRMYGSEFGLSLSVSGNVTRPLIRSFSPAPPEIIRRDDALPASAPDSTGLQIALSLEGLDLVALDLPAAGEPPVARATLRNLRWRQTPRAL